MLLKSTNGQTSVHGITSDKTRWRREGGSELQMYIETSKLLSSSNKRQFANNFLSNKFTTISSDNYSGDEEGHLVQT